MKQLDVYKSDVLIGYLCERDDGTLAFAYDSQWRGQTDAVAVSPELPIREQWHEGEAVTSYFDNLLPEGSVRDFVARATKVSPSNIFGLLERFGGDTAGALSLLPHGQRPSTEPRYMPVTTEAIREWFASSRGVPLNLAGGEARMSLSGAQDKMTVFIDAAGALAIPLNSAPSSHILKPAMDYRSHVPQTAINEALVMRLAAAVRLDVPEVYYHSSLDAVVVTRYDREVVDGRLRRLHQNDLCQTMGVAPGRKYESDGGPTFAACCAAMMQHSSQPAVDKKRLIEWVVFNVAVGNMDSHAKNLSLLTRDGRTRLAPFYDLVCTSIYENLSQRFAFKIGGENRPGWMMDRHWERFAAEIAVKPQLVHKIRLDVCERIEHALPMVANELRGQVKHPEGLAMIDSVEAEVRRSVGRLKARAVAKQAVATDTALPAWGAEQERRAAGLDAPKGAATGALLTFAEIATEAIQEAGGAAKVDWRQVEDAAIARSLKDDHQPSDEVYQAIASASPDSLTEQQHSALRERIDSMAQAAQNTDRTARDDDQERGMP